LRGVRGIVFMLRLSKSVGKKKIECRIECLTLERVIRHLGRSYSLSERCWLFRIVRWRVLMNFVVENPEESGMMSARLRLARHAASSVLEHKTVRQYVEIVTFPELFSNDYIEF